MKGSWLDVDVQQALRRLPLRKALAVIDSVLMPWDSFLMVEGSGCPSRFMKTAKLGLNPLLSFDASIARMHKVKLSTEEEARLAAAHAASAGQVMSPKGGGLFIFLEDLGAEVHYALHKGRKSLVVEDVDVCFLKMKLLSDTPRDLMSWAQEAFEKTASQVALWLTDPAFRWASPESAKKLLRALEMWHPDPKQLLVKLVNSFLTTDLGIEAVCYRGEVRLLWTKASASVKGMAVSYGCMIFLSQELFEPSPEGFITPGVVAVQGDVSTPGTPRAALSQAFHSLAQSTWEVLMQIPLLVSDQPLCFKRVEVITDLAGLGMLPVPRTEGVQEQSYQQTLERFLLNSGSSENEAFSELVVALNNM